MLNLFPVGVAPRFGVGRTILFQSEHLGHGLANCRILSEFRGLRGQLAGGDDRPPFL